MVKEGTQAADTIWRGLFSVGFYKRSQGRIARIVTALALILFFVLTAASLQLPASWLPKEYASLTMYAIRAVIVLIGAWISVRMVNYPRFADFLIAVEAEMNKVAWPTRKELFRSSIVVMLTIFGMATLLFCYDYVWAWLLKMIGVL